MAKRMGMEKKTDDGATGRPPVERAISDEALFRVAKEIVVKFIEVGRMTPASFEDDFARIYRAVERAVRGT